MTRSHECVIAVPVRNEAAHLPALLGALARQRGAPPFALSLFFDSCTDASRAIVEAMASALPYPVMTGRSEAVTAPNAGRARAAAAALALSASPRVILSTDADSEPADDWVAASLSALDGAELVAGRIVLGEDAAAPVQARVIAHSDRLNQLSRRLDPVSWEDDATHHWTSASSLALHADTYRALGGFGALARGEDADLADRAWREGYRLRRDARVRVRTSARRCGRIEGGFASSLAGLDSAPALPRVAHPADEAWRYRRHAEARGCFATGEWRAVAERLRLASGELERVAAEVRNAEAFAARVVGAPPGGMRSVSLAHAEAALSGFDVDLREGAA